MTDSVAIEARARTNVIRIKPSSYHTFGNPSSVRARFLGTRAQSGGMRLDKKGLTIDSEESFDEFKWFEIDFYSEDGMSLIFTLLYTLQHVCTARVTDLSCYNQKCPTSAMTSALSSMNAGRSVDELRS